MSSVLERASDYEKQRGKPMPSLNHGVIQMRIGGEFLTDPKYTVASEVTLDLGTSPNLVPDLLVFDKLKLDLRHDQVQSTEVPILIVEILSPPQGTFELLQRVDRYFEHGVKSCWIVYPTSGSITVYGQDGFEQTLSEGVVEDPVTELKVDLQRIFD